MLVKSILLVLILSLMGVSYYDVYLTHKGELGLVAQFMDFAGLGKYEEPPATKVDIRTERYHYDSDWYTNEIIAKRLQILELEKKLWSDRKAVIDDIIRKFSNLEVLKVESKIFQKIIEDDQAAFAQVFPDFDQNAIEFLNNYESATLDQLQQILNNLQRPITSKLGAPGPGPDDVILPPSQDRIPSEFKQRVEDLVRVTDDGVRQSKALYKEMERLYENEEYHRDLMQRYYTEQVKRRIADKGIGVPYERIDQRAQQEKILQRVKEHVDRNREKANDIIR